MKSIDTYWYSRNPIAWILFPLSMVFCGLSKIRRLAYQYGFFKSYQAPVPLIIVGNISVGGTGKTPLIIELVRQLKSRGLKPAVISRGYGSQARAYPFSVTPDSLASEAGDEPLLIARRAACPVVIGADRQQDIEQLLAENDCDIILSDDGMQHYALQRDVEIAVVDASRGLGNGFCLPAGPLRETPGRLKQVDLLIVNGGQEASNMQVQGGALLPLNEMTAAERLKPQQVHGVAGIGNPQRFFDLLSTLGFDVIPHEFADHYQYRAQDLDFKDDLPVIMTEKDAVKCMAFNDLSRCWYLPIEVRLSTAAQTQFNQLISQVCNG